ncbi:putative adhesin, partial [Vibrio ichthyoenteri ATCC 700023]
MNKIISCLLLMLQLCSLVISPVVYAYPLLSYSGSGSLSGMHFSPNLEGTTESTFKYPIYLHIYSGIKPNLKWVDNVIYCVKHLSPALEVKVIDSVAPWQLGQHRVIVGPIESGLVVGYSKALTKEGIDNFPIYFNDGSISLINNPKASRQLSTFMLPTLKIDKNKDVLDKSDLNENQPKSFYYSDELSLAAQTLIDIDNGTSIEEKMLDYARSEAERYTETHARDWLSQYGTAKVKVDFDSEFHLKSSELDLLMPIMTNKNGIASSTWFVQPGFVLNDDGYYNGRDFAHIGVGYRAKGEDSLYGLNAFYDYDMTRFHQRASIGVEYARDFIKLSSNYYFPLSDWKDSPEIFDSMDKIKLEERPAQGIDFHFTGYLAQYPSLSLSSTYKQYFGENVEVSNGDDPVSNPYQIDTDVIYTPIPLLSFNTGYTHEKGGINGLHVGANASYRFGVPLQQQLDSSQVALSKSLDTQMFDLVERDHNIRLEYRKKQVAFNVSFKSKNYDIQEGQLIELGQWLSIDGDESNIVDIKFEGNAKDFIQRSTLLAHTQFIAPLYRTSAENDYGLSIVVKLINDQVIKTSVIIHVVPDTVEGITTEIAHADGSDPLTPVVADGKQAYVVTAILKNKEERALADVAVHFDTSSSKGERASIVDGKTDDLGKISVMVTETIAEKAILKILTPNKTLSVPLTFTADAAHPTIKLKGDDKSGVIADNNGLHDLTSTVLDVNGNAIEGILVTFSSVTKGATVSAVNEGKTDVNGIATAVITSTSAGSNKVTATVGDKSADVSVPFV